MCQIHPIHLHPIVMQAEIEHMLSVLVFSDGRDWENVAHKVQ